MNYDARHRTDPELDDEVIDASDEARAKRLARNIIWNYASGFISVFGLVLLYPFAVKIAGTEAYGLWVLIFGTVQLLSTADFGLGTGIVRQLGVMVRDGATFRQRQQFVTVAMSLFFSLGVVLTLLYCVGFPLYLRTIPVRDSVKGTESIAVAAGGLALFFTVLARGANSVLWAEDRQDIERKSSVVGMVFRVVGYTLSWWLGWSFLGVVASEVLSLLVTPVICSYSTWKRYPFPDFSRAGFEEYVRPLVGLSSVLFVGSLATLITFQLPIYIVGSSLGLAATTAFGAVTRVLQSGRLLISWIANPFIQQIASADEADVPSRARQCYTLSVGIGVLLAVGVATLSQDVIEAWLGREFLFAAPALALVSLGLVGDGIGQPSALLINLRGNPWRASLLNIAGLVLAVAAIIPAQHTKSVTWIMLATTSVPLAICVVYVIYGFREIGGDPFRGHRPQQLAFVIGMAVLGAVLWAISHLLGPWPALAAASTVVGAPVILGLLVIRHRRRTPSEPGRRRREE